MPIFNNATNTTYINNLTQQINSTKDCADLQKLLNQIEVEMEQYIKDSLNQINLLKEVMTPPTDLGSAIGWINNMITLVTGPYTKAIESQIELITAYTQLLNAVTHASSTLQCNLTIPTPPSIPTLPGH